MRDNTIIVKARDTGPQGKRQKVTSKPSRSKAKKSPRQCVIQNMPVDVLTEIMSYLRPYDLLMLARSNTMFRNHLMTRNAAVIWRRARRVLEAPAPPPLCSEPRWANLLFGGSKCQNCGTPKVTCVNFTLCRRLCSRCRKKHLVAGPNFSRKFPNYDSNILNLIPHTLEGYTTSLAARGANFYWADDIHAIHKHLTDLRDDVGLGEQGVVTVLRDFEDERKEAVSKTQETASLSRGWYHRYEREQYREKETIRWARMKRYVDAFIELGYKKEDVDKGLYGVEWSASEKEMTPGVWTRTKNKFEPEIISARDKRLLPVRKALLKPIYETWVRSLKPVQWAQATPISVLMRKQFIRNHFNQADGGIENPTAESCASLVDQFHNILSLWPTKIKTEFDAIKESTLAKQKKESLPVSDELAVVRCSNNHYIYGSTGFLEHRSICALPSDCSWSHSLCFVSCNRLAEVVREIGEDPKTATASRLDLLDKRLCCLMCSDESKKIVLTWRQWIEHRCKGRDQVGAYAEAEELEMIRQLEASQPTKEGWTCAHCSIFYGDSQPLSVIQEHLRESHHILQPVEPQDYLWDFRMRRSQIRDPVYLTTQQPGQSAITQEA